MKKDKVYLKHIVDAIAAIEKFLKNKNRAKFFEDDLLQSAVIRKIEIIGEATKNISQNLKKQYVNIPWKNAAGMRDKLIHEYFGVNIERVWETCKKSLPEYKKHISKILKEIHSNF